MKRIILAMILLFVPVKVWAGGLLMIGSGEALPALAACTTANDSAIFDDTGGASSYEDPITNGVPAARQFVTTVTKTITEYLINVQDVNNLDSLTLALYTDSSNSVGTIIADTTVTIAAGSIPAGPGVVAFTLASPKTGLAAGTYWVHASTGSGSLFKTWAFDSSGIRVLAQGSYYDNYSHQMAVYGCSE